MQNNKLDTLTEKRDQINTQIQAIKQRGRGEERKKETRRKILIGGIVLKMVKNGEIEKEWLDQILRLHLNSDRDRVLFGLPEKNKSAGADENINQREGGEN